MPVAPAMVTTPVSELINATATLSILPFGPDTFAVNSCVAFGAIVTELALLPLLVVDNVSDQFVTVTRQVISASFLAE